MADKHVISTEWKGDLTFESSINNHKIIMDVPVEAGGNNLGPGPKKLMLVALSGCTGMDVVSILKKMRVDIEKCNIEVQGDVTDENPKQYFKMHVIYTFTGKDLPMDKLEKAVKMSEETYCGVGAVYRKVMEVSSEIRVIAS
ncbi:MAG TPA: OsmC family protein [Paludibacter sp.]|nr:OsmC family protein [Paludibacter sp.]